MAWKKVDYGDTLRNGTKGDPVCDVQRFLNELGVWNEAAKSYIIRVDGYFGKSTEWGVKYYQNYAAGLKGDGIVGSKTWSAMRKGIGSNAIGANEFAKLIIAGCSDWD